jgi:hypothetical protein
LAFLPDLALGADPAASAATGPARQKAPTSIATTPNRFIRLSKERLILFTIRVADQCLSFMNL